jgi:transcriptional regulator with XRE-family HTH domain
MSEFGDRLRAAREKKFASAEKFAQLLVIHPHRYRKYERGQSQPDFELLTRICWHLEVTPNDLLPEATKPIRPTGKPSARPRKAGPRLTAA